MKAVYHLEKREEEASDGKEKYRVAVETVGLWRIFNKLDLKKEKKGKKEGW